MVGCLADSWHCCEALGPVTEKLLAPDSKLKATPVMFYVQEAKEEWPSVVLGPGGGEGGAGGARRGRKGREGAVPRLCKAEARD